MVKAGDIEFFRGVQATKNEFYYIEINAAKPAKRVETEDPVRCRNRGI